MTKQSAIVIGAGIAGLATARALANRGYQVFVLERNQKAIGASIRNFGMIWPIGQPGEMYETAILSRNIWKQVCEEVNIWYEATGSLHLAYSPDELSVLEELKDIYRDRQYELLNADQVAKKSAVVVKNNLMAGLYSNQELIIDPRISIVQIANWLSEQFNVQFLWNKTVTEIVYPAVFAGDELFEADEIYVCNGADFETLYPQLFALLPLTKCKLQMMRMGAQTERIGPALCGGLSLAHYTSFKIAPSLETLMKRFEKEYAEYLSMGIHVMVSQNEAGELTIGDSHEYGLTHDPFDKQSINKLILDYLKKFARFNNETITESWNGIYPKLTDGRSYIAFSPEAGVNIINGLGGAGMTLSFGLCEQLIGKRSFQSKEFLTQGQLF